MDAKIFDTSPELLKDRTFNFPEYGILPFKPSDLDEDEMSQILYELEDNNLELSNLFRVVFGIVAQNA